MTFSENRMEHEGEPYCKGCHSRLFAAGGLAYNLGSSAALEEAEVGK